MKADVDTYASPFQHQATAYTLSGLSAGTHTVVVEATQTHNPSSGGSWVWVDAFQLTSDSSSGGSTTGGGGTTTGGGGATTTGGGGTTTGGGGATTTGGGGTAAGARVEQSDPAVIYSGSWFVNTNGVH